MARKYRLNNRMLRNIRKNEEVYQAVITDLKLLGKISGDEAKRLLGCEVPAYVTLDAAPNTEPNSEPAQQSLDDDEDADDEEDTDGED